MRKRFWRVSVERLRKIELGGERNYPVVDLAKDPSALNHVKYLGVLKNGALS